MLSNLLSPLKSRDLKTCTEKDYRVLIVDDDAGIRETLRDILNELNYQVDIAADGPSSLKKIMNGDYDTILLDFMMPGMNGMEILAQIAQIKDPSSVIMMTGHKEQRIQFNSEILGARGILFKPFGIEDLLAML